MADTPPRNIVRIEITAKAKQGFAAAADRAGLTQVAAVDRLVHWLSQQSEGIQLAVLGQYPDPINGDIAKLLLQHKKPEKAGRR